MHTRQRTTRRTHAAFTLIELIVVIAIIGLLCSLLFPALGRSRATAKTVYCMNNLRQVYVASALYANDNDDMLPDADTLGGYYYRVAPGSTWPDTDPFALKERYGLAAVLDEYDYMPGKSEAWVCPSQPEWMINTGNTYSFATGRIFKETRFTDLMQRETVWAFDNYFAYPASSGFRTAPGPGMLIPKEKQESPHLVRSPDEAAKPGCNYLYTNGKVILNSNN